MRILIAEDEQSNLEEIKRILAQADFPVDADSFLHPNEALNAAMTAPYDAALLDIQMPGMNGLVLAERINELQPEIGLIFITAFNNYATEAFDLHAIDYILKPLRAERLLRALERIRKTERRKYPNPEFSSVMRIVTFGGLRVFSDAGEVFWDRPKTRELFAYLLMKADQKVHKHELSDELWPSLDSERALANLQVTICRLRKSLAVFSREQVNVAFSNHYYTMHLGEEVDFDAARFDRLLFGNPGDADLSRAIELYEGGFMDTEGWIWPAGARDDYQKRYGNAVLSLAERYVASGDSRRAEAVLNTSTQKADPEDRIAKALLNVAHMNGGRKSLVATFRVLASRYDGAYGVPVPKNVILEFERLRSL